MKRYVSGFYRINTNIDTEIVRSTLDALGALDMGFLPAAIRLSRDERLELSSGADYDRRRLPKGYYIDGCCARIPLESANGVSLTFTESHDPKEHPANLLIEFTNRDLRTNGWTAQSMLLIFRAVLSPLNPDYAFTADEDQFSDPQFNERRLSVARHEVPLTVHWINYFPETWTRKIGAIRLASLREVAWGYEERSDGAVLFVLTESAFDVNDPLHRARQVEAERRIGLSDLHIAYAL
jgi:hypothetical protein